MRHLSPPTPCAPHHPSPPYQPSPKSDAHPRTPKPPAPRPPTPLPLTPYPPLHPRYESFYHIDFPIPLALHATAVFVSVTMAYVQADTQRQAFLAKLLQVHPTPTPTLNPNPSSPSCCRYDAHCLLPTAHCNLPPYHAPPPAGTLPRAAHRAACAGEGAAAVP